MVGMNAGADSTAARTRRLAADVIDLIHVRLELAAVEAREDAGRLVLLGALALLAVLLLGLGLMFLGLWITVVYWDSGRLMALGGFTLFFVLSGIVLALVVRAQLRRGLRFFRSTLDELERDREHLQS